jgi:hypothetical protein
VTCATAHALNVPEPSAPCRALAARRRGQRLAADGLVVGHAAQACSTRWLGHGKLSARCAHGPSLVLAQKLFKNLKNSFLFFIRFQTEFKLQKFVSKYPELQKL